MWQNAACFLVWKPAGLATARGNKSSLLDMVANGMLPQGGGIEEFPSLSREFFCSLEKIDATVVSDAAGVITALGAMFSVGEEYGLVNRLDTDTSGLVYFARSREVYTQRRSWQEQGKIKKYYLAQVSGDVRISVEKIQKLSGIEDNRFVDMVGDAIVLNFPLMHHATAADRMVSCQTPADEAVLLKKGRGKLLSATSWVKVLSYDVVSNTSVLRVTIEHGWRHQIRVHLATLGAPILGDMLYGKGDGVLQLVSAGVEVT